MFLSERFYKNIRKKGFSVMEIVLVMLIVGILIGIGVPNYSKMKTKANLLVVKVDSKNVRALVLLDKDDGIIDGKAINKESLKDKLNKEKSVDGKLYINGENNVLGSYSEDVYELFLKDDVYRINKDYLKTSIDTELDGEFFTNMGGDIYYLSLNESGTQVDTSDKIFDIDTSLSKNPDDFMCSGDIDKKIKEIEALNQKIKSIKTDKENLESKNRELVSTLDKLRATSSEANDRLQGCNSDLSLKDQEIESLRERLLEFEDGSNIDRDYYLKQIEQLEKEKLAILKSHKERDLDSSKKIKELDKTVVRLSSEIKALEIKVSNTEEDRENALSDLYKAKNEIILKEKTISDQEAEISRRIDEIDSIKTINNNKISELNNKINYLKDEADKHNGIVKKYEADIDDYRTENRNLISENKEMEKEILSNQKVIDNLNKSNDLLKDEVQALKDKGSESGSSDKELIDELKAKISKLEEDLALEKALGSQFQKKIKEMQRRIEEHEEEIAKLESDIKDIEKSNNTKHELNDFYFMRAVIGAYQEYLDTDKHSVEMLSIKQLKDAESVIRGGRNRSI